MIAQAQAIDGLVQYGIAVLAMAGIFYYVVRPLIQQNSEALTLLRKSVETNTLAVQSFERHEEKEAEVHHELKEGQEEIRRLLQVRLAEIPKRNLPETA